MLCVFITIMFSDKLLNGVSSHFQTSSSKIPPAAVRRISNCLLGVWKCDESWCLIFDVLLLFLNLHETNFANNRA